MILAATRFVRETNLTARDITEILRAQPGTATVTIRRCDNWHDGWLSAIYSRNQEQLAIAIAYPSPMEAFRAACEKLAERETVRWRDTDVVIA